MALVGELTPHHTAVVAGFSYAENTAPHKGVGTIGGAAPISKNQKGSTSRRGYGHIHQQARRRLIYNHQDGAPCQYCGKPMYRDKERNWDGLALAADHEVRQMDVADKRRNLPTRLLHGTCNSVDGARAQWGLPHTPIDTRARGAAGPGGRFRW